MEYSQSSSTKSRTLLLLALSCGVVIGLLMAASFSVVNNSSAELATDPNFKFGAQSVEVGGTRAEAFESSRLFSEVAKATTSVVVSIRGSGRANSDFSKYHDEDQLREFFEQRNEPFEWPRGFHGSGSGIIVSEKGYIVTNAHVVKDFQRIDVRLSDNRHFEAEVVAIDPLTEVAVIKVNADHLPAARLGNSDEMQVGDWVLAIGNPLDLSFTVTAGIISAKGRDINIITNEYGVEDFIQTDAAINPGNSGGALVNLAGEVIGMNTAIATRSGFNQGYGFAIPTNLVKRIAQDLITRGHVVRAYLGISMREVTSTVARGMGLDHPRGVFIDDLLADGPAGESGVERKDILLAIDGKEVHMPNQVQSVVARRKPGDRLDLRVFRSGKDVSIPVVLGQRKTAAPYTASQLREKPEQFANLGLEVEARNGVVVQEVKAHSPAFQAGFRKGDRVLQVGDASIAGVDGFNRIVSQSRAGDVLVFSIQRGGYRRHLFVEVPE